MPERCNSRNAVRFSEVVGINDSPRSKLRGCYRPAISAESHTNPTLASWPLGGMASRYQIPRAIRTSSLAIVRGSQGGFQTICTSTSLTTGNSFIFA